MAKHYPKVLITDETLRDGLQIERMGVTVDEKLEILNLLLKAGVKRLLVGAFVNPKWSPQMADTPELLTRITPIEGVQYFALALNDRGRELRTQFMPPLSIEPLPATHLHLCEVFLKRNTNRSFDDQERTWQIPVERAKAAGVLQAAIGLSAGWGSNWRGAISHDARMNALQRQWDAWSNAGIEVKRVDLADPMAWNTPDQVAEDLIVMKQRFPSIDIFHFHLHNARSMAMLSVYEALKVLSADDTLIIDAALGGIGGCPYCGNGQATGMIPTEDLAQLLEVLEVASGLDLDGLIEASVRLSEILGRPLHSQVARNGGFPKAGRFYDPNMPVVYTFKEAQHFRLGVSVYEGNARPWIRESGTLKKDPSKGIQ